MKKLFKILGITILIILILIVILTLTLFIKSKIWERNFKSDMNPQYLISESVLKDDLNEKIETYVISQEDMDFTTFLPEEIGKILFGSLTEIVKGSNIEITNIYIEPAKGVWQVCARSRLMDLEKVYVWICVNVTKDSMQTAQLYITDLSVQGIDVGNIYPKSLSMINQGIAEALVTANENGFVGRVFENMELLEDELIVKGSLY